MQKKKNLRLLDSFHKGTYYSIIDKLRNLFFSYYYCIYFVVLRRHHNICYLLYNNEDKIMKGDGRKKLRYFISSISLAPPFMSFASSSCPRLIIIYFLLMFVSLFRIYYTRFIIIIKKNPQKFECHMECCEQTKRWGVTQAKDIFG